MRMGNKFTEKLKTYLSVEILIEYKACLYFGCILAYACFYFLCRGIYSVNIFHMLEMIFAAYFVSYLQVYVLHNLDEAERYDLEYAAGMLLCAGVYTGLSYLLGWFERNAAATGLFAVYMLLVYFCITLINKLKRKIDTENLNRTLEEFKKGNRHEREREECH